MLRVALSVPDRWQSRARYAFGVLATRWMIPVRFTPDPNGAHVCYAAEPSSCPAGAVALRFDPGLYEPSTVCRPEPAPGGGWIWCRIDRPEGGEPDLVGGVYRLLQHLDESGVLEAQRDRRGIFRTDALPSERLRVLDEPLVEHLAAALLQRVLRRHPALADARIERWPQGRRFAVAPSHDVDAVNLGAPGEMAANLAKAVLRRDAARLRLVVEGARYLGRPGRNPYFAFATWREWEGERGIRSAFYVFHRPPGTVGDVNDCKSSLAARGVDWAPLRRLADEGWEFGLHPSIHSKDTPGAFAASRAWLESKLGHPVHGVRHHYWALDWREPWTTHRQHEAAGFAYDSSIAWRERAGFRAGTALPYPPFDPVADRALDLLEIPCVLMDGHILHAEARGTRTDSETATQRGRSLIERVRACRGVLTTNWHQESACDRFHHRGYVATLGELLQPLIGSSDVWLTTPYEICRRWKELSSVLAPGGVSAADPC